MHIGINKLNFCIVNVYLHLPRPPFKICCQSSRVSNCQATLELVMFHRPIARKLPNFCAIRQKIQRSSLLKTSAL